jgi:hypothetical protein
MLYSQQPNKMKMVKTSLLYVSGCSAVYAMDT